jgi:hypothetical protein
MSCVDGKKRTKVRRLKEIADNEESWAKRATAMFESATVSRRRMRLADVGQ